MLKDSRGAMIKWISLCWLVFILGFAQTSEGQAFETSDYDAFIKETMSASTVPGLAIVLFEADGTVYEKAFGVADADKTPVTLDTPFQLGSVSKSFAALLVVQLAAEGLVELDAPVINYLPDFRTKDAETWKRISVKHVLSHLSGLSTLDGNRLQGETYRGADALVRAVKTLENAKLKSEPGVRFEYSNANYMIAAALVESVTGQTYETHMAERIFTPLGMRHSYVQMTSRDDLIEAAGFRQWFGVPVAQKFVPGRAMMGAGGVTTSARDLAIYVQAVVNKDPRIIPSEYADDILAPIWQPKEDMFGYGFGWMHIESDAKSIVYHSGLNSGFAANAAFIPSEKRGGVVLTNQSGSLQADVAGAVLRQGLGLSAGFSRPSTGQYLMVWGLVLTVVTLAFSYVLSTIRFSAYAKKAGRVNIFRRVIPAIALFALAYGLVFIVPSLNGVPLSAVKVFQPDIGLCLGLSAGIATLWGLTRLIYPLRKSSSQNA